MAPELVIFDCDGVLVDSEAIANRILHEALVKRGWQLDARQTSDRFTGRRMVDCLEEIENALIEKPTPAFWREVQLTTFAAFDNELEAVEGIHEVIETLKVQDIPFCVASSGSLEKMRKTLGLTELLSFFEAHMFSAADVGIGKPAPDLFLHAAKSMDRMPHQCLVIEDSLPGVQAGQAAGMQVFGYSRHTPDHTLSPYCTATFDSMYRVRDMLTSLF